MLRDQLILRGVLLVEDSELQREIAAEILKDLGFGVVVEAKDGEDALQKLHSGKIDLILSDWQMPVMDGLELLKQVKATPKYKDIPFIILTVVDEKNQIIQAVKEGITDYIIKPVERQTLKVKLKKIFDSL